jgi:hypothetical protein
MVVGAEHLEKGLLRCESSRETSGDVLKDRLALKEFTGAVNPSEISIAEATN